MSKENLKKLDDENKLVRVGDKLYRKFFITEHKGQVPETIWDNVSNSANASDMIKKMFNGNRKFILCTNNENNICEDITYQD